MSSAVPILIVDDRPANLMVVEAILEPDQYALVRVQSAQDALLAMLQTDFAAVLLNVKMPEVDGYELAALYRERKELMEQVADLRLLLRTASSPGDGPATLRH